MKLLNLKEENLYYIGGIVRDMILDRECFDIDITYVGNAIEYAKTLKDSEILQINKDFGTVKILIEGQEVDLASTRYEEYPQAGHLPRVVDIGCSLERDVKRRDFTINALAKSLKTGEIVDFTGGLKDIKTKTLRVLHDKSFIDDPTRIIRGLKFSVRFGFELDLHTRELQDKYLDNVNYDMSWKRVKKELVETFNLNSQQAFDRFFEERIYKLISKKEIIPPKFNIEALINKYNVRYIWLVYLGWMDLSMLPLTKQEQKIIDDYKNLTNLRLDDDYSIYKAFKKSEPESILLYAIMVDENKVYRYMDYLSGINVRLSGKDIIKLGIEPSKKFAECFDYILEQKLINPDIDEEETAKKFFKLI